MNVIKQIAHVCVVARDMRKTVAFYTRVLGLRVQFKFLQHRKIVGYYLNAGGNSFIEVFEQPTGQSLRHVGALRHICLEVDSIKKLEKRLAAKNWKHTEPRLGADNCWQMWTEDPDGVRIEFHEYTKASTQLTKKPCRLP